MIIEQLAYHNHLTGWQLVPTNFGAVNLLVGISGVGKTKILESIQSLRDIAFGKNISGVEWDITFSTSKNCRYRWCGEFNIIYRSSYTIDSSNEKKYSQIDNSNPNLKVERLYLNDNLIASRDEIKIKFQGNIMPKLSPSESLIKIFMAEDIFKPIISGWLSVLNSDAQRPDRWVGSSLHDEIEGLSLSEIRKLNTTLVDRLGLLSINHPDVFAKIKSNIIAIFSQVEDIRVLRESRRFELENRPSIVFSLEMKEIGVERWISQSNISTGMLKTLTHITEIYLTPKGSVLLLDEFENSLGMNCIDVIDELLSDRKDMQFIITSHHPYLINKIPMQYWKIVTRKGSLVTARNATDYEELSGSKHKVFTQLINLPAYTEGIQVG